MINGTQVTEASFPFVVYIALNSLSFYGGDDAYGCFNATNRTAGAPRKTSIFCTGSLVTPNMILTAGHCVKDIQNKTLQVVYDIELRGESKKLEALASWSHPLCDVKPLGNSVFDIGIIQIKKLSGSPKVVPLIGKSIPRMTVFVEVGYGFTDHDSRVTTQHPRLLHLYPLYPGDCVHHKLDNASLLNQKCFYDIDGIPMGGDSGGPLLFVQDKQWTLAGITTWTFREVLGDEEYSKRPLSFYTDLQYAPIRKFVEEKLNLTENEIPKP